MDFNMIDSRDYDAFHRLLNQYFREGEDEDTPQEQVDAFIQRLFDMVRQGKINCRLIARDAVNIGFVLWAVDTEQLDFSEIPGMGTILEIGIEKPYRRFGAGTEIVRYVEDQLRQSGISHCYVSAYGPAQKFWKHCGYQSNGTNAGNGLPIMIKHLYSQPT